MKSVLSIPTGLGLGIALLIAFNLMACSCPDNPPAESFIQARMSGDILLIPGVVFAAGIAMCSTHLKGDSTRSSVIYVVEGGNFGYEANRNAREALARQITSRHHPTPSCRNNLSKLKSGFATVISAQTRRNSETRFRYAVGFGESRSAALEDAKEEMKRRNWFWNERDGFKVETTVQF